LTYETGSNVPSLFLSYLSTAEVFKVKNLSRVNISQKGKYFPRDIEDSRRPALAELTFKGMDVTCPVVLLGTLPPEQGNFPVVYFAL
jgi:hypothetical protein